MLTVLVHTLFPFLWNIINKHQLTLCHHLYTAFPPGCVNIISSGVSELVVARIDTSGVEPVSLITICVAEDSVLGKWLVMPGIFHSHDHIRMLLHLPL